MERKTISLQQAGTGLDRIACRKGCGACCIAPSISSPLPGMPEGKPAGIRCIHLTRENLCGLYEKTERPDFCGSYAASEEYCGSCRSEALARLTRLEELTVIR